MVLASLGKDCWEYGCTVLLVVGLLIISKTYRESSSEHFAGKKVMIRDPRRSRR